MSLPSFPPAVLPEDAPCEVRMNALVVRYRRAGTGRPVLLLGGGSPDALWTCLEQALSEAFRLFVPAITPADDLCARLPGFLDGLGVSQVCVVAGSDFCGRAAELLELPPEQVARTILIAGDAETALALDASLAGLPADVPVLLLHGGMATDAALPAILRFVAGEEVPLAG